MVFGTSARKRSVAVGSVIAGVMLAASSLAGAHGGDATRIHACVVTGSGSLRVVGADESCRKGETALDWTIDSATDLNAFRDELKNLGTPDSTVNETTDPLSWFKLDHVPAELADGTDAVDGGRASDVDCPAGCVSDAELSGTIDAARLSGAISGSLIEDGTVTAGKLGSDVGNRFLAVEGRAGDLETRASNLAVSPAPGDTDRVHSSRLLGQTIVTTDLDPTSMPAMTRTEQFIPVAPDLGLEVGDLVTVTPPPSLADDLLFVGHDLRTEGEVVSAVVVYLYNNSTEEIDDGSRPWRIQFLDLTP